MRHALAAALMLHVFAAPGTGQDKKPILFLPDKAMEVGQVGRFTSKEGAPPYNLRVDQINKDGTAVVLSPLISTPGGMLPFVAKGVDASKLVEGKHVSLDGIWEVTKVGKVGSRRHLVVERHRPKK